MKVYVIEDSAKIGFGGGQRITEQVIKILSDAGAKIFLLDTQRDSELLKRVCLHLDGYRRYLAYGRIKRDRPSYNAGFLEKISLPIAALLNWLGFLVDRKLLKDVGKSVCYAATKKAFVHGLLFKALGAKLIYHAHSLSPRTGGAYIFGALARRTADLIICVSASVAEEFRDCPRALLVRNSVPAADVTELAIRRRGSRRGSLVVGFVGALVPLKGYEEYFEIARRCNEREMDFEFLIFGANPAGVGVPPWVSYKGFTPSSRIFTEIDVLVSCTRSPESFGLVLLEAQQRGIPVVAPRHDTFREVVAENRSGFLYQPGDLEQSVEFLRLLQDGSVYASMSDAAEENSKRFSFEEFKIQILKGFGFGGGYGAESILSSLK